MPRSPATVKFDSVLSCGRNDSEEPLGLVVKAPEKIVRNGAAKTARAIRQSRILRLHATPALSFQPRAVSKRAGVVRRSLVVRPAGVSGAAGRTGSMTGALIALLPSCGGC